MRMVSMTALVRKNGQAQTTSPCLRLSVVRSVSHRVGLVTGRRFGLRTGAIAILAGFLALGFLSGCSGEGQHQPKLEDVHTFYSPD
ncbi:MAG: hypothetical protein HYX94_12080 [Chloroflexi bacterium]|nr:hypothetical protein [Chloroflexota bacterium]